MHLKKRLTGCCLVSSISLLFAALLLPDKFFVAVGCLHDGADEYRVRVSYFSDFNGF